MQENYFSLTSLKSHFIKSSSSPLIFLISLVEGMGYIGLTRLELKSPSVYRRYEEITEQSSVVGRESFWSLIIAFGSLICDSSATYDKSAAFPSGAIEFQEGVFKFWFVVKVIDEIWSSFCFERLFFWSFWSWITIRDRKW